ncbi:hypothetical protein ACFVS2_25320 [Brevibacillus sp. NPDC058079]|uniref:hypothetical protein n=1 Tax=Brevibacillus sp. NPDC058079 TaxID=3346330 RepID=UPI0036E45FDE
MALYIVSDREQTERVPQAFIASIAYSGEIFIDLGVNPTVSVVKEIEKIAKRYEKEKETVVYQVSSNDHFMSLWLLSEIFLHVVVIESDIGKFNAGKLMAMKVAQRA